MGFDTFRDANIQVTMREYIRAHKQMTQMDTSYFDKRAKLAWEDCLEFYDDSIDHLNRSLSGSIDNFDSQTWLSAVVANQQTCENGFVEFGLSHHLKSLPNQIANLSKLVSNSLAINKVSMTSFSKFHGRRLLGREGNDFPYWVSAGDRKLLQSTTVSADAVVAQDGSGNYKTINDAVNAAASAHKGRFVIYIKKGVYKENVVIKKAIKNVMMIGDGIDATIITASKSAGEATTFRTATVGISGPGFIARDITFQNTAGPENHQAVAVRSSSDFSIFYSCSFKGYQDTLYVYSQRQFYRNCDIYGTIDFIFGDAVAILQNCNIYVRKPLGNQWTTITAQGRKDPNENTGIVIHNSRISAASDLRPVQGSYKTYLGRPWKQYSRTIFMKNLFDGLIAKEGWLPWSGSFALSTLYYGEYMNSGPGSGTDGRVKWSGCHPSMSMIDAGKFTVKSFLAGDSWIPSTGVPFDSGL
ncbi:hypothetical protein ACFE04_030578 [Oxalis oulophora]